MNFLQFENLLQSSRTLSELQQILKEFLASLKITTYSFTYYSYYPNSLNKLKYDFCSDNYKIWHQHYLDEYYQEVDSTLEKVYRKTLPLSWDLQEQLKEAKNEKEKMMRQDSIEFGATRGMSIPIHGPNEDFAILLVVEMQGENCLADAQNLRAILFTAGYYFYSYLQAQLLKNHPTPQKFNLNKRQIQCLTLIAKQFSVKAISHELHITERTVNYHIQKLNKKLGTKNKYQSVSKAIQNGLLRI